jgi:predicted dehydrogenase
MPNRRAFLGQLAAATAASALPARARILGANDRIRIGLIGGGARGQEIFKAAIARPNVEPVAVADVYTRRLDQVRAFVPGIAAYRDARQLLDDKSIDAVLIATPQHLHCHHFEMAMHAGKDAYQEKTMAFTPAHARRMRKAFEGSGRVVQIGMQMISGTGFTKVRELVTPERMGTLTALATFHFRNAPYGGWLRELPPDCDEQHVDWTAFEGEAKHYAFDPMRFFNWRFYWDYSGGNMFENMIHQVGFWFAALELGIPQTVTTAAANFRSPKMEVPDTMNISMHMPEKLLFNWNSIFGNDYYGETHDLLFGSGGTITHTQSDQVEYAPQGEKRDKKGSAKAPEAGDEGYQDVTADHMQNFFDCVRSRRQPHAPFELGFRASIAVQMAVASYRRGTTVRWDPATDEII